MNLLDSERRINMVQVCFRAKKSCYSILKWVGWKMMMNTLCKKSGNRPVTQETPGLLPCNVSLHTFLWAFANFWTKIPFLQWGEVAKVKLRPLRWIKKILTKREGFFQARFMSYIFLQYLQYFTIFLQYFTIWYSMTHRWMIWIVKEG